MKMKWRKTDGGRDEGKEMKTERKIAGKGDGDRERKRKIEREREADRPVEEEMKIEG